MAELKVTKAYRALPVPPPIQKEAEFELKLTPEEVAALAIVLEFIGGNPDTSIRKHMASINDAVKSATKGTYGTVFWDYREKGGSSYLLNKNNGGIVFLSDTLEDRKFCDLVERLRTFGA